MSHLDRNLAGTRDLQRIFNTQLDDVVAVLSGRRVHDAEVHEARKTLKKARATLRLLRDELGRTVYARENGALRDAARPLSRVRDARVLPQTLEELVARYGRAGHALPLARLAKSLHGTLARERKRVTRRQIAALVARVRAVHRRSSRWQVGRRGWTVLGGGLARTYRRGRETYAAAQSRSTPELHEWRKQVKYLRYQFQLLEPLSPAIVGKLANRAHMLTDYLGEDHDLAVLAQTIDDAGSRVLAVEGRESLLAMIEHRRTRLQNKAFVVGRQMYADHPGHLRRRFGDYWRVWHGKTRAAGKRLGGARSRR